MKIVNAIIKFYIVLMLIVLSPFILFFIWVLAGTIPDIKRILRGK